jgi:hypothetical protein
MDVGAVKAPTVQKGCPMQTITTIGLDIAKSVFQVHGVDAVGEVVVRRQLKRRYDLAFFQKLPTCLAGIEACASRLQFGEEQLRHSSIPSKIIVIPKCDTSPTFGLQLTIPRICFIPQGGRNNSPRGRSHFVSLRTQPETRARYSISPSNPKLGG